MALRQLARLESAGAVEVAYQMQALTPESLSKSDSGYCEKS